MAKNTKNNEETTDLAVTSAPAAALVVSAVNDEFADDVDVRTKDEIVLERLRIVQGTTKGRAENNLVEGQIFGSVSRVGHNKLLIVPVYEYREIVERSLGNGGLKKGAFIKAHGETQDGSGDFGDLRVNKSIEAAGGLKNLRKSIADANGNVTELILTYNCFVAVLDQDDGVSVVGFGVLQADKTNITPYLAWRQNRTAFAGSNVTPPYAIRTLVDGMKPHTNSEGQVTKKFNFQPFKDNNWKSSCLNFQKGPDGKPLNPTEYALVVQLKEQRNLMKAGALKVAEHAVDETLSEDAAEDAAF